MQDTLRMDPGMLGRSLGRSLDFYWGEDRELARKRPEHRPELDWCELGVEGTVRLNVGWW